MTDTASPAAASLPIVIQGGMGVSVSDWNLARAVSRLGQLGVVSGTALDAVHARRLGDGDTGGHLRRAYAQFPVPTMADRVLERWFIPEGRSPGTPQRRIPLGRVTPPASLAELTMVANFAEVWLAKEGHDGQVGINYLEKLQLPTPHAIYGAMLAGVDYVLMGAGIPAQVPSMLSDFAQGVRHDYRITVAGANPGDETSVPFDPAEALGITPPGLTRPRFLAIVASNTLVSFLMKDAVTTPDGFVVEGPSAGGHNAPPRGKLELDEAGEPIYGPRDAVDLDKMAAAGLPFWLAGGYTDPAQVDAARQAGAAGVQIGTAFALCDESGIRPDLKSEMIRQAVTGEIEVRTDPLASPSGFPFKVVNLEGTLADDTVYEERDRICDLGFLRTTYLRPDGRIGFRCPSEPVDIYVSKGGKIEDTVGRKCLCNGLMATAGLAQERDAGTEAPIVTAGDDLEAVVAALAGDTGHWSAADVIEYLLGAAPT